MMKALMTSSMLWRLQGRFRCLAGSTVELNNGTLCVTLVQGKLHFVQRLRAKSLYTSTPDVPGLHRNDRQKNTIVNSLQGLSIVDPMYLFNVVN